MTQHSRKDHSHGSAVRLTYEAESIVRQGLTELLAMAEGLVFKPSSSERYSLPLCMAVYGTQPDPQVVREQVRVGLNANPIAALAPALVLLELHESNQPACAEYVPDDGRFLAECFKTKRLNGWLATLGSGDANELESAVNVRWQFKFIPGRARRTGIYSLLNMVVRFGFVYGRIAPGDSHAMGHFIEDFAPGVLVCHGEMDDLELTLSLAAMKLGIPAVVTPDYPFPLGRRIVASSLTEIGDAVVAFPNIHRLLDVPEQPRLPDYLDPLKPKFEPAVFWGDTAESFCILRKGPVATPGRIEVIGRPSGPIGVVITVEGEPLDAFDRRHIEGKACDTLSMIPGMRAHLENGRLSLRMAASISPDPRRMGETLIAAICITPWRASRRRAWRGPPPRI